MVIKMGRFESPNFDFCVINFDTMKLIFCVKTAEPHIPRGFWSIEKERKLQYQWYHNFRSYVVEMAGVGPLCLSTRSAAAFYAQLMKIGSFPYATCAAGFDTRHHFDQKKKRGRVRPLFLLVEMAGVEPASEDQLPRLSTSVAGLLKFPQCSAERQALHLGSL